jgi:hypothetical protein
LSLEMWKFAKAERVPNLERGTCVIAMRDGVASPGSKAGSRMESNRRNMRGPIRSAGLVSGGGWQRGKAELPCERDRESDWPIVPMTPSKETRRAEGRGQPGRNPTERGEVRTQGRGALPPNLARVNAAAGKAVQTRFTALLHHVDVEALERSFRRQKRRASAGVDGITVADYEQNTPPDLRSRCRGSSPLRRARVPARGPAYC